MKNISYNFGALRDSIAKLSSMEILKEGKSETLDVFLKKTNSSSNLKKQQLIYKNIQECKPFDKERLAERFLNQNLNMFKNSNWQDILRENMSIRKELLGNPDISHVEAKENGDLFESVNIMIESITNPAFSKFEEEAKAYNIIIEFLTREVNIENKSEEKEDSPSLNEAWKFITKLAVNNFNKRYQHLNESEKQVLSILMSNNEEKEGFLKDLKKENVEVINKLLENEDIDKNSEDILIEMREKIERIKEVSKEDIDEYILECIDLKQNLNLI